MSLDEKSEEGYRQFISQHPWAQYIIKEYGLDLSVYDFGKETSTTRIGSVDRGNFIEDTYFLKTFDEYVRERLPQGFSSVLEVGTGPWTYVYALATFFRRFNNQTSITGIDIDGDNAREVEEALENRPLEGVQFTLRDVKYLPGVYDVVVNLCPNITSTRRGYNPVLETTVSISDFFYDVWRRVSQDGLFVMGINHSSSLNPLSETGMEITLTPFFRDININKNPYATNKSLYSIDYIITAKPKLPTELTQS